MENKICKKCRVEKPLSDFYKDKGFKSGYKATCKECGDSRHNLTCQYCSKEFVSSKRNQKYCSIDCLSKSQQKRVKFNCDYCGEESESIECNYNQSKFHYCSKECRVKGHAFSIKGENNGRYNSRIIKCDYCSDDITRMESQIEERNFCDIKCYSEYRKLYYSKENHSSWKGGNISFKCCYCGNTANKKKSQYERSDNSYCSTQCSWEHKKIIYARSGNPRWSDSITDEERIKTRDYLEYEQWRVNVFERDNYTCLICKKYGVELNAHHLNGYDWDVENRTNVDNGITLCKDCHKEFHTNFGYGDNTLEQFKNFMINKSA